MNEVEPKKRQTLKNLFGYKLSRKKNNLRISDPETGKIKIKKKETISHQDSSEFSSPPSLKIRINNLSRKHILEPKFSPFTPEVKPPRKSPICRVLGLEGKAKLNEIIEGLEGKMLFLTKKTWTRKTT